MLMLSSITDNNVDEDEAGSPRPFSQREHAKAMESVKAMLSRKSVAFYAKPIDFDMQARSIDSLDIR